ncbi:SDR family oxidoreductase [Nocardia australiensis]|uniref:SDR family oxidoreductase n=1 Tax=Nocardia australiensis TaxID=2887191 RepID=UPI001D14978C|nr:SDR family oxidoreductase [Nocardia australiensis]
MPEQSLSDKVVLEAARPEPLTVPYAAAEAGLANPTGGLAQSFAPTVRVNTIQCGAFATDISAVRSTDMRAELTKHVALGHIGAPSEIVRAAIFFATDASASYTGATRTLDDSRR